MAEQLAADPLVSGFDMVASGFDMVASGFDMVASGFDMVASGSDMVYQRIQLVAHCSYVKPNHAGDASSTPSPRNRQLISLEDV